MEFYDGLLDEPSKIVKVNSRPSTEPLIRDRIMKLTDQNETSTTTLQSKIDSKKKKVDRKLKHVYQEPTQPTLDDDVGFASQKNEAVFALDTEFQQLGLGKGLIRALTDMGFTHPTKVQKEAIPVVISGKDVMVSSMTGSGKTGAFLLPALQRFGGTSSSNYSKVLVVLPTRELAFQCFEMLEQFNKYVHCSATLVIGAVPIAKQEVELRKHPDIIIATPGRLVDLLKNSYSIDLQNIEMLIFDEADRLLEMGFEKEIQEIIKETPKERQTVLFSATMTSGIHRLTSLALKKPVRIQVDFDEHTATGLKQYLIRIRSNDQSDREAFLLALLTKQFTTRTIVFVKTKRDCHRIAIILGLLGIRCCELHGNLSQQQRIQAFEQFKTGEYDFLLATDLAARGLDIQDVQAVINYEIPYEITRYIHRVGRTARIGNEGVCATLCLEKEVRDFKKMVRQSKLTLERLQVNLSRVQSFREQIESLEPEIKTILMEEFEERQLRKAEMEAQKAENLLQHDEDINRRPKKKWIESFKSKLKRQNVVIPSKRSRR